MLRTFSLIRAFLCYKQMYCVQYTIIAYNNMLKHLIKNGSFMYWVILS